jgi:hypothetical protein
MAKKPHSKPPNQFFSKTEQLFRRVQRERIRGGGKVRMLAFELPDMSVNRERYSTAEEARRGHDKGRWGVAVFTVADIPPRTTWVQVADKYRLAPRHVPEPGNYSHSEVRVWRNLKGTFVLITDRKGADVNPDDPDRNDVRNISASLLDPDFHMRWRKHIALVARVVLPCEGPL